MKQQHISIAEYRAMTAGTPATSGKVTYPTPPRQCKREGCGKSYPSAKGSYHPYCSLLCGVLDDLAAQSDEMIAYVLDCLKDTPCDAETEAAIARAKARVMAWIQAQG